MGRRNEGWDVKGPAVRGRSSGRVRGPALLLRRLRSQRRWASALLLALAAALGVRTATADVPAGVPVLVAARDLATGHSLAESDLTVVRWPADAAPDGMLRQDVVLGRKLSGPLRRGEAVTDARLAGPGQLVGQPPDTVAMSVPVPDPALLSMLHRGDVVRVIAGPRAPDGLDPGPSEGPGVLVHRAVVLAAPTTTEAGLLGGDTGDGSVVLALSAADAVRVVDTAARRPTAVALLP